jgi:pyridoxal phosphate enzyme (YggS family)
MTGIAERLNQVLKRIRQAELQYRRAPGSVKLLVVSKGQSVEKIKAAFAAKQAEFGENYLQEGLQKISALQGKKIEWHFIGRLQSNKAKDIAKYFAWVESLDNLKIAERLNNYRSADQAKLNVCIEVNLDQENQKAGVVENQVLALAKEISCLPRLNLRGLMVIPKERHDFTEQRLVFRRGFALWQALLSAGLNLDTLSMGMSEDFEAAIAEGSTLVRIGRAVFGSRD